MTTHCSSSSDFFMTVVITNSAASECSREHHIVGREMIPGRPADAFVQIAHEKYFTINPFASVSKCAQMILEPQSMKKCSRGGQQKREGRRRIRESREENEHLSLVCTDPMQSISRRFECIRSEIRHTGAMQHASRSHAKKSTK